MIGVFLDFTIQINRIYTLFLLPSELLKKRKQPLLYKIKINYLKNLFWNLQIKLKINLQIYFGDLKINHQNVLKINLFRLEDRHNTVSYSSS